MSGRSTTHATFTHSQVNSLVSMFPRAVSSDSHAQCNLIAKHFHVDFKSR